MANMDFGDKSSFAKAFSAIGCVPEAYAKIRTQGVEARLLDNPLESNPHQGADWMRWRGGWLDTHTRLASGKHLIDEMA